MGLFGIRRKKEVKYATKEYVDERDRDTFHNCMQTLIQCNNARNDAMDMYSTHLAKWINKLSDLEDRVKNLEKELGG